MKRSRRVALLGAAVMAAGACAKVIGVDDYKSAAAEMCGPCDASIPDCADRVEASLAAAPSDEVIDWLKEYDRLGCAEAGCGADLLRCFYTAPGLCVIDGGGCERSEECCGFDFDKPAEGAGCCAGDGTAVCCSDCRTCTDAVDAYANQEPFDETTLCLTQRASWDALFGCATSDPDPLDNCEAACVGPMASAEFCKSCLAETCPAFWSACDDGGT